MVGLITSKTIVYIEKSEQVNETINKIKIRGANDG